MSEVSIMTRQGALPSKKLKKHCRSEQVRCWNEINVFVLFEALVSLQTKPG